MNSKDRKTLRAISHSLRKTVSTATSRASDVGNPNLRNNRYAAARLAEIITYNVYNSSDMTCNTAECTIKLEFITESHYNHF